MPTSKPSNFRSFLAVCAFLLLISFPLVWAAEKHIGTIVSPDGGAFSNYTCLADGGSSLAFTVPTQALLSVQCGSPSFFAIKNGAANPVCDITLADGGPSTVGDAGNLVTEVEGILVPAGALFQTSTDQFSTGPLTASMLPSPAVADAGCKVFTRTGKE